LGKRRLTAPKEADPNQQEHQAGFAHEFPCASLHGCFLLSRLIEFGSKHISAGKRLGITSFRAAGSEEKI
jgi:hypothetical protein